MVRLAPAYRVVPLVLLSRKHIVTPYNTRLQGSSVIVLTTLAAFSPTKQPFWLASSRLEKVQLLTFGITTVTFNLPFDSELTN